ncbi:hypothetical protein ARMGADRAFT_1038046 [Armillaria gallica]|uniref:Uncharacterized protein n=1 Tax=Armillaria gallica TaxID=47427 RepID=A0A2H3CPD2_ARMGA|nr:hypothetical protein ARMGADRAFT_1038046 [Armillaria gallica]
MASSRSTDAPSECGYHLPLLPRSVIQLQCDGPASNKDRVLENEMIIARSWTMSVPRAVSMETLRSFSWTGMDRLGSVAAWWSLWTSTLRFPEGSARLALIYATVTGSHNVGILEEAVSERRIEARGAVSDSESNTGLNIRNGTIWGHWIVSCDRLVNSYINGIGIGARICRSKEAERSKLHRAMSLSD